MSKRSIRYSEDFKRSIVKLYHDEHRSANSLAQEYGVTVSSVTKWIKQYQEVSLPNGKILLPKNTLNLKEKKQKVKRRT